MYLEPVLAQARSVICCAILCCSLLAVLAKQGVTSQDVLHGVRLPAIQRREGWGTPSQGQPGLVTHTHTHTHEKRQDPVIAEEAHRTSDHDTLFASQTWSLLHFVLYRFRPPPPPPPPRRSASLDWSKVSLATPRPCLLCLLLRCTCVYRDTDVAVLCHPE